jgi:hypothetical protein
MVFLPCRSILKPPAFLQHSLTGVAGGQATPIEGGYHTWRGCIVRHDLDMHVSVTLLQSAKAVFFLTVPYVV